MHDGRRLAAPWESMLRRACSASVNPPMRGFQGKFGKFLSIRPRMSHVCVRVQQKSSPIAHNANADSEVGVEVGVR